MARTEFKGRRNELQLLDALWQGSNPSLLILYGRRRVGKTRLLTHWMGKHAGQAIYWVAEPTSSLDQLRSFSQALYNYSHLDMPAPLEFSYATWEQAMQQAAMLAKEKRLALFIDEVTYLMDVNPSFPGMLQKAWDHWLSHTDIILALSGSQMGMMQDLLNYEAPLYGRAAAQIKLPPLPYNVTAEFFPNNSAWERMILYSMFGGIPAYWERLDPSLPVMENVQEQLLTSNTLMQEEPRLLLADFINDPPNYVAILRAIAYGAQTQHLISKRTGLSSGHISKYLSVLRDTGFVERRVPITEDPAASRRGHYDITDPFLRFYYRFLSTYQTQLALGEVQRAQAAIEEHLPAFIEDNTWPELCREWLVRASAHGELPLSVTEVGSAWKRTHDFDVVGIDVDERHLVVGSAQVNEAPASLERFGPMLERLSAILPKKGNWKLYLVGFATGGWQAGAAESAARMVEALKQKSKNYHPVGVQLVDLAQVDADLARWALPEYEG